MIEIPKGDIVTPMCYQKLCRPEHYMIKYNGFGISETILSKLQDEGIKIVRIIYMGKRGTEFYLATTKQFLESEKKHLNNGNDPQKFVSVGEMLQW